MREILKRSLALICAIALLPPTLVFGAVSLSLLCLLALPLLIQGRIHERRVRNLPPDEVYESLVPEEFSDRANVTRGIMIIIILLPLFPIIEAWGTIFDLWEG